DEVAELDEIEELAELPETQPTSFGNLDIFKENLCLGDDTNENNLAKGSDPLFTLDIEHPDFSALDSAKSKLEELIVEQANESDAADAVDDYEELDSSELVQYIDDNAAFSFAIQFKPPKKLESASLTNGSEKVNQESIIESNGLFRVNKDIPFDTVEIDKDFVSLVDSVLE
ncbi:MAG TPA: hypothetical protein DDW88_06705, partial [Treponema sp.]|nr:hypothetical protein [Treponema sp.]